MWAAMYPGVEADYSQASAAGVGEVLQLAIESVDSIDPAKVRDALAKWTPRRSSAASSSADRPDHLARTARVSDPGRQADVIFPDYIKQAS